jgi:hypothetical protein
LNKPDASSDALGKSIRRWKWAIAVYVVLTFASYGIWFGVIQRNELSIQADVWGQAGDFIGGLLNPVVALAAFFWLIKGVELQKQELSDTRKALDGAMEAQKDQALYAAATVRLNALTALVNATKNEVDLHRDSMKFLAGQIDNFKGGIRDLNGAWIPSNKIDAKFNSLNNRLIVLLEKIDAYEREIGIILKNHMAGKT